MLEVSNITKWYGSNLAVDKVNFTAKPGEVVGFLGPNGAGKSTTMKIISGFLSASEGQVLLDGIDIEKQPIQAKQLLGYLPEGAPAYSDMSVLRFLSFIAKIRGIKDSGRSNVIDEIIHKVNLEPVLEQKIDTLSKGFKRRVGLAQAILHNPPILILDEPTDGLDPNQKYEVRKLIKQMAPDKVIILSTHILEEVEAICDRVIVVAAGKVIADSSPQNLIAKSQFHNTIQIRVKGDTVDKAETAFLSSDAVSKVNIVTSGNSEVQILLHPENSRTVFNQIHTIVNRNNWELLDINTRKGQLDEVFREMTGKVQEVS